MKRQQDNSVPVDVLDLLDRLDTAAPNCGVPPRRGRWLVDRWWRLIVLVIPDHTRECYGHWLPGVYIDYHDRQVHFRTDTFVAFDECRLTQDQIERIHEFIDRWVERRNEYRRRRTTGGKRDRKSGRES